MKFAIPFDEKIFKEQIALNFNEAWKRNLLKNKKNIYGGIVMIIFGSIFMYLKAYMASIFLALGLFYLINSITYYFHYKKTKRKQDILSDVEAQRQINSTENSVWEFHEEYLMYKDYRGELKLKWLAFQNYRIIQTTLFIDIHADYLLSYIISEEEIGKEQFEAVVAFVGKKISKL